MGESPTQTPSTLRKLIGFMIYRVPLVMPVLMFVLRRMQYLQLGFYKDGIDVKMIREAAREKRMLLQPQEAHTLLALARMQALIDGDLAEVGVFQGASAKLICRVKGDRHFWGFDTFAGLSDVSSADTHWGVSFFKSGGYSADQAGVASYLVEFPNVHLVPGYFPESAGAAASHQFSFAHLDVDTYESTLASLRFFWPRLVAGGLVLIHDSHAAGVMKAIDEFRAETSARAFSTTGSQFVIVK
jgi:O-methyltransferase